MKLLYKSIAPERAINGNGSVQGGWIFEKMDFAALTLGSEDFIWNIPNASAVTSSASIKYHNSLFPHEYIEIWGKYAYISPAKYDVTLEGRRRRGKSNDWELVATAEFSFSLIDKQTRNIIRIPREVVHEIKG